MTIQINHSADTITSSGGSGALVGFPVNGFKNRIINGAMNIWQRGTSLTYGSGSTAGNYYGYLSDRWFSQSYTTTVGNGFAFTSQKLTATPPSWFANYLGVTVTSSQATLTSDALFVGARQAIEGFNVSDFGFGTANAKPITLSFLVRSSVTGTFAVTINEYNGTAWFQSSYTVNAANTWEQKTISISACTIGTWATNNSGALSIDFILGASASRTGGTANTWTPTGYNMLAGCTNLAATSSATWQITGVQLEKGSTATSFDYRPYGTELALCQRYLPCFTASAVSQTVGSAYASTSTAGFATYTFKVTSRVPPTGVTVSNATHFEVVSGGSGNIALTALAFSYASVDACTLSTTVASGQSANAGGFLRSSNAAAQIQFTGCEL